MKKLVCLLFILGSFDLYAYDDYDSEDSEYQYEGSSGTKYKYDLSDPSDQIEYETDLDAQMDDSLNPDPGRDLDRSLGQYGGGAKW